MFPLILFETYNSLYNSLQCICFFNLKLNKYPARNIEKSKTYTLSTDLSRLTMGLCLDSAHTKLKILSQKCI